MIEIVANSVEYVPVDVRDRLKEVSSLEDTSPKFDWRLEGSDSWVAQNQSCIVSDMQLLCLVNTTGMDPSSYELFVIFTLAPETPRLGPIKFNIV